jgi:hypothetical protein
MQLEGEERQILLDALRESITTIRKAILSTEDPDHKQGLRKREEMLKALAQKFEPDSTGVHAGPTEETPSA